MKTVQVVDIVYNGVQRCIEENINKGFTVAAVVPSIIGRNSHEGFAVQRVDIYFIYDDKEVANEAER